MMLRCGDRSLDLSQPLVMGVLNVTPDSFSDGGQFNQPDNALRHAIDMVEAGAAIIDIGGESTRPGAASVSVQEELDRVIPLVEAVRAECDAEISVDTSTPEVMTEAARAGAGIINDIRALERPGALAAAAASGLAVCVMHMQGEPATMQQAPEYDNVVIEVRDWLSAKADACIAAGIPRDHILLDPGIGFGKNDTHNLALLKQLPLLAETGFPLLVGASRKSMIGRLLHRDVSERLAGSLAIAMASVQNGASIMRVHDVAETVDVLRMMQLLQDEKA